jgi:peptidoglycan/xylan/chitin deacetylase (PgdA/CDA1 family)
MRLTIKRTAVRLATLPPIRRLLAQAMPIGSAIFTLHRFENRDLDVVGHPVANLAENLHLVRRLGYRTLPVADFVNALEKGTLATRTVSFTVDDGYEDFVTQGAPVFARFDCPVTIFATTGFVDRQVWFWWDKLEYLFERTERRQISVELPDQTWEAKWESQQGWRDVWESLVMLLKRYPERFQPVAVERASLALQVDVPDKPPRKYAPMTWAACNALAASGVTVGPHSVSHPNLAKIDAPSLHTEVTESWRRVQTVAAAPSPVYCYPYGDRSAFGEREARAIRAAGLSAAVTFVDERIPLRVLPNDIALYTLPRVRYADEPHTFAQQLLGLDVLKQRVRKVLRLT